MRTRNIAFLSWTVCCLFSLGCDPVRTTRQTIVLRVTDSASQKPMAGIAVELKSDFDRSVAESGETQRLSKEVIASSRDAWEHDAWTKGVTNASGDVEFVIEVSALDRTYPDPTPPADRDITGQPYLVRKQNSPKDQYALNLRMKPGEAAAGKSFSVTVIRIDSPRYIEKP